MKLKDILKEETWKADKSVITLNGEKVGDYSYDRDSDSFWMDNIKGSGQKSFDTTREMLAYIKAHKADYLKARKAYVSRGHIKEGQISISELNPNDQKQIKQLENIIGGKLNTIYTGRSGDGRFVASIKVTPGYSEYQFTPDIMRKLLKFNIKYAAADTSIVNVAFN